jgi:hypothetical protein
MKFHSLPLNIVWLCLQVCFKTSISIWVIVCNHSLSHLNWHLAQIFDHSAYTFNVKRLNFEMVKDFFLNLKIRMREYLKGLEWTWSFEGVEKSLKIANQSRPDRAHLQFRFSSDWRTSSNKNAKKGACHLAEFNECRN